MAGPIRITKRRAEALLDLFEKGLADERSSIEEAYGVSFNEDGTLALSAGDYDLLDPGELDALGGRLEALTDALAAAAIFRRRYT